MIKKILFPLHLILFTPHYFLFKTDKNNLSLSQELEQWCKVLMINKGSMFKNFMWYIINLKEYRSLFYHRLGGKSIFLSWYSPGKNNLYISTKRDTIGVGLVIQHGHSTIIHSQGCGKNCQIWQNVTLGKAKTDVKGFSSLPTLGDNVKVCTGAIVLGDIFIGNNVTIAAGSIVVKSVPDNCVVAGNPAKIIRKDGQRVNIIL